MWKPTALETTSKSHQVMKNTTLPQEVFLYTSSNVSLTFSKNSNRPMGFQEEVMGIF